MLQTTEMINIKRSESLGCPPCTCRVETMKQTSRAKIVSASKNWMTVAPGVLSLRSTESLKTRVYLEREGGKELTAFRYGPLPSSHVREFLDSRLAELERTLQHPVKIFIERHEHLRGRVIRTSLHRSAQALPYLLAALAGVWEYVVENLVKLVQNCEVLIF